MTGSIDLTGEKDRNWLNQDPPEPEYATASEEERQRLWDELLNENEEEESEETQKRDENQAVLDWCLDAIEKSSWWLEEQQVGGGEVDLQKAPGIWRTDDQVPDYVQDAIEEVIRNTDWDWGDFESLTNQEAEELKDLLEEKLTQPQGWSLESLTEDIQDRFDLPDDAALGVAADTSHNVLSESRMEAYEEMEEERDETFEFDWVGPADHRRTEVCEEVTEEIEDRGGAVPRDELKEILLDKAEKYEGTREGGTPWRIRNDILEPHYQCRHVAVRRV